MITIPQLTAHALGEFLSQETKDLFGSSPSGLTELLPFAARLTLECIGNSDALYHNIEHTMLVTLVGHDILVGRALQRTTTASDYANFILACLTHDIGYVRGVVQGDEDDAYVADISGTENPVAGWIVRRRARALPCRPLKAVRHRALRFHRGSRRGPDCPGHRIYPLSLRRYAKGRRGRPQRGGRTLLRAADLIGQLGDPNYMRKSNALFHEFEEIGLNKTLGYATPADIVYKFPQFYWTNVAPQIQLAIRYLNVTSSGRQWIANLHSNVFRAEREVNLSGPQR